MRNIIYTLTLILFCGVACTDIRDTYSKYQGDGERVYVGKLTDVRILEGYERLMVKGATKYLATAKECLIELEGTDKSYTVGVDRTQPEFSYEIKDLKEGNYYIKIVTKDKEGNSSLIETYNADVYGPDLIATYYPKKIVEMKYNIVDQSLDLNWNQVDNIYQVIVNYWDKEGEKQTITVKGEASVTNLPSWETNSELTAQCWILPDTSALDPVALPVDKYTLPNEPVVEIPRDHFANAKMPSDVVNGYGGAVEKMWDNKTWNYDDGYHAGDGQGVPHHITIDMGLTANLTECELFFTGYERTDWMPQVFQIWGIEDVDRLEDYEPDVPSIDPGWEASALAKGWKKLTPDNILLGGYRSSIKFACDRDVKNIRYIRYRIVEALSAPHVGLGAYGSASEIKFWGKGVTLLTE